MLLGILLGCLLSGAAWWRRVRRARERERGAIALHDTLLQSTQALILRFQCISDRLPENSAERAAIEQLLDQADEVLAEGRRQVLALLTPQNPA